MPWNTQSGGGNGQGPRGPWGRGPSGGGGGSHGSLPILRIFSAGFSSGWARAARRCAHCGRHSRGRVGLAVIWILSGVYFCYRARQGVVLRFGQYVARTPPGINYHLPWPIETVETPEVTTVNQITIGYRTGNEAADESQGEDTREE